MPDSAEPGAMGNIQKKPTAQTAHLVFADTEANAEKTKRAVFCRRSTEESVLDGVNVKTIDENFKTGFLNKCRETQPIYPYK
ncbi:hypothetical protein MASR1M74_25080 [Lentimicrobium sp.]